MSILIKADTDSHAKPDTQWHSNPDSKLHLNPDRRSLTGTLGPGRRWYRSISKDRCSEPLLLASPALTLAKPLYIYRIH